MQRPAFFPGSFFSVGERVEGFVVGVVGQTLPFGVLARIRPDFKKSRRFRFQRTGYSRMAQAYDPAKTPVISDISF